MNRSTFSFAAMAVLALGAQAFAADRSGQILKTPIGRPITVMTQPVGQSNVAPPPAAKLISAKFLQLEVKALEPVSMKFDGINLGAGSVCGGTVVWGDGTKFDNMLANNGMWGSISKTYTSAGTYTAVVTPKSYSGNPCVSDGPISATIKVNPPAPLPPSVMTQLVVTPVTDPLVRLISTKWNGNGNPKAKCSYLMHFGDGASKKLAAGPAQPGSDEKHTYAPGTYSVIITPLDADYDSCSIGPNAGPKTFTVE
jgi:hypothetical protein